MKKSNRLEKNRKELIKQILEESEEDPKIELNDEELEKRINERLKKIKKSKKIDDRFL